MEPFGPFEAAPRLGVAVSGGADSLALALLAGDWARGRGGEAVAFTVDHRLRPQSGEEARRVGAWLAARGIGHHVLAWAGDKPVAGLQAAARAARYRLLGEACAARGILHLLVAHHREDQAETLLLRLGRGSGLDGLAAMAPERPTAWGRVLRPLLPVGRERLAATLLSRGQDWVDDPSNRNPAFARVRLRRLEGELAAEGLSPGRLAATAARLGRARTAVDAVVAEAAARHVHLDPAGWAAFDPAALAALPGEVGLRLLARLLLAVGGGEHTPRLERLEGLYAALAAGSDGARTLAGCRLVPSGGRMLVCREPGRVAPPVELLPGGRIRWDGRFEAVVAPDAPAGLRLGALGPRGRRGLAALMGKATPEPVPVCAWAALPALYGEQGIFAVPHLGYNRDGAGRVVPILRAAPCHGLTVSACAGGNRHYL